MKKRKKADLVQLKVRVRQDVRERIERAAAENQWSVSAEVSKRLNDSFEFDAAMAMRDMAMAWKQRAQHLERIRLEALRSGNIDDLIHKELEEDPAMMPGSFTSTHWVGEPGDIEAAIRRRRKLDIPPMIGEPRKKRDKT